jgi:hypothetical protein
VDGTQQDAPRAHTRAYHLRLAQNGRFYCLNFYSPMEANFAHRSRNTYGFYSKMFQELVQTTSNHLLPKLVNTAVECDRITNRTQRAAGNDPRSETTVCIDKTVDIREGTTGAIQITTNKLEASPHAVSSNSVRTTIRNRSGTRKALGVTAGVFKSYYRPDLRHVSIFLLSLSFTTFRCSICYCCYMFGELHFLEPAEQKLNTKVRCEHNARKNPVL